MIPNSKPKRQKTQNTERWKTSFIKGWIENAD